MELERMCVLATGIGETRAAIAEDAAMQAGRLVADVMSWWTLPGSLPASGSS